MLSDLYAALARRRRERFARRPFLRRRLRQPVVSIGNLAVGGRGKTPMAAFVARLLRDAGERPAILSRGYGRTEPVDGVVVVSAAGDIRADLPRAGDLTAGFACAFALAAVASTTGAAVLRVAAGTPAGL